MGGATWVELSEVATVRAGAAINKRFIADNPGPFPVINSGREPLGFVSEFNVEDGPIGVASRGAGVGQITWTEGRFFRGNLNYGVIPNPDLISPRFLFHLMNYLQPAIHKLCTFQGIPALNRSKLMLLRIPLIAKEEQVKISNLLDKFDALVNDLSSGLPAEIEARRKQYEYYRDKLLTFKELQPEAA